MLLCYTAACGIENIYPDGEPLVSIHQHIIAYIKSGMRRKIPTFKFFSLLLKLTDSYIGQFSDIRVDIVNLAAQSLVSLNLRNLHILVPVSFIYVFFVYCYNLYYSAYNRYVLHRICCALTCVRYNNKGDCKYCGRNCCRLPHSPAAASVFCLYLIKSSSEGFCEAFRNTRCVSSEIFSDFSVCFFH